jgi:Methyltransferase domain
VEQTITCPVCGAAPGAPVLRTTVLDRFDAALFECVSCRFVFVGDPHWLAGSFESRLNAMDVGSVDRSLLVASYVRGLIGMSRSRRSWTILDVGGGDGLVTRVLRDAGIDCRWQDPYCTPVYDVGPPPDDVAQFDLALMSEVALHLTDPLATFEAALARAGRLLFTAVVPPRPIPDDWWYLMPSTGQHVAFYRPDAIGHIAERLGVDHCSDGRFFHLLSHAPIDRGMAVAVRRPALAFAVAQASSSFEMLQRARGRRRSLTEADQARALAEGGGCRHD